MSVEKYLKPVWHRDVNNILKKLFDKCLTNGFIFPKYIKIKKIRNKLIYNFKVPVITTLSISPSKINYINRAFHRYWNTGDIVGGGWDKKKTPITNSPWYKGIVQRYQDNHSWEDTVLFEFMAERIKNNGSMDNCYSKKELLDRLNRVDSLYNSLKEQKYDRDMDPCDYDSISRKSFDCVCVHIDRNGEFLFKGGAHHRLMLSKYLQLDSIPVRVIVRHKQWQKKRQIEQYNQHPDSTQKIR